MPRCVVPGCISSFGKVSKYVRSEFVQMFAFPRDPDLLKKWILNIPRKHWAPTKSSRICIKHFSEKDISRAEIYKDKLGIVKVFPRSKPVLKEDAIPTIFETHITITGKTRNENKEDPKNKRWNYTDLLNVVEIEMAEQDEVIDSFDCLNRNLSNKISQQMSYWQLHRTENEICFYQVSFEYIPYVRVSIKIPRNLIVQVCVKNQIILSTDLNWALPATSKLSTWSQLRILLDKYGS